jgi:hypothetical protein
MRVFVNRARGAGAGGDVAETADVAGAPAVAGECRGQLGSQSFELLALVRAQRREQVGEQLGAIPSGRGSRRLVRSRSRKLAGAPVGPAPTLDQPIGGEPVDEADGGWRRDVEDASEEVDRLPWPQVQVDERGRGAQAAAFAVEERLLAPIGDCEGERPEEVV